QRQRRREVSPQPSPLGVGVAELPRIESPFWRTEIVFETADRIFEYPPCRPVDCDHSQTGIDDGKPLKQRSLALLFPQGRADPAEVSARRRSKNPVNRLGDRPEKAHVL